MNDAKSTTPADNRAGADLRKRLMDYSIRILHLFRTLPKATPAQVIGKQLLRSAFSVGAHHREAYRAKSTPDFVSKLGGALGELDESAYWLELLERGEFFTAAKLADIRKETDELLAILVSSIRSAKGRD